MGVKLLARQRSDDIASEKITESTVLIMVETRAPVLSLLPKEAVEIPSAVFFYKVQQFLRFPERYNFFSYISVCTVRDDPFCWICFASNFEGNTFGC